MVRFEDGPWLLDYQTPTKVQDLEVFSLLALEQPDLTLNFSFFQDLQNLCDCVLAECSLRVFRRSGNIETKL